MKMYKYPKSITEAALILDKASPGWWKRLDVATLDMNDSTKCVLGQTFKRRVNKKKGNYNGFEWAMGELFGGKYNLNAIPEHNLRAEPFGYTTDKQKWLDQIEARKSVASA